MPDDDIIEDEIQTLEELEIQGLVHFEDYEEVKKRTIDKVTQSNREKKKEALSSQLDYYQEKLKLLIDAGHERNLTKRERDKIESFKQKQWELEKNLEEIDVPYIEENDVKEDAEVETLIPKLELSRDLDSEAEDDADEEGYLNRISHINLSHDALVPENSIEGSDEFVLEGGYRIPKSVYNLLFEYQKKSIEWLWGLYCERKGGILGDDMGLGKTVQIVTYLSGLEYSSLISMPILIVCPATIIHSWVREFHKWWPQFRVSILHGSGRTFKQINNKRLLSSIEDNFYDDFTEHAANSSQQAKLKTFILSILNQTINNKTHYSNVFVTSYATVRAYIEVFGETSWEYAILDEGHYTRNPDADVTISCKKIKTKNRLILTGTPIQNNLIELWSLFDFIVPGILGTLPTFKQKFSVPISMGCYINATRLQRRIAHECARILKDIISPYLLMRHKDDVARGLPGKTEKIVYCKLTKCQVDLYQEYINREFHDLVNGKKHLLCGIDTLRKICNHPDLLTLNFYKRGCDRNLPTNYGDPLKSGKLHVLISIFKKWVSNGCKALIFSQTIQMLDIIEKVVISNKYSYLRLDGGTPLRARHKIVSLFNRDQSVSFLLLSTRVGGIGLNLIGANRVLIYDPDWNPSCDMQAKERSWRIGQLKDVIIYRMLTKDTLEEKIYNTQTFKHYLANQILKKENVSSEKNRVYKFNNLTDLLTLGPTYNVESKINPPIDKNNSSSSDTELSYGHNDDIPNILNDVYSDPVRDNINNPSSRNNLDNMLNSLKDDENSTVNHFINREVDLFSKSALSSIRDDSHVMINQKKHNPYLPTWTGNVGMAGKPPEARRSASVSQNSYPRSIHGVSSSSSQNSYYSAIKKRLISFIKARNSSCSTDSILKNIGSHINDSNAHLIKRALNDIATFDNYKSVWMLKK